MKQKSMGKFNYLYTSVCISILDTDFYDEKVP